MGNMTPQQQQQYKQQQMQMQQQQQMYKMNQYNSPAVPGQPGSGPATQQPMNPIAYNPQQSQQGGYSAYPGQHQYTNGPPGQLNTSPANPQVNKLNPMPPHMSAGQYAGYSQQPNPNQVAANPNVQQRQQSPQTPYAASPNKMVGYPNGNQGMSVNVAQSPGPGAKPPQSSPGRMATNAGPYYQQGQAQQQGAYPQYQMSQPYGQPGAYQGQGQQQQGYSSYATGGANMVYSQAGPQAGNFNALKTNLIWDFIQG